MKLPFTEDQFLENFTRYNNAMWPLQFLFLASCVVLLLWSFSKSGVRANIAFPILSAFWLWNGFVYHWLFFSSINPAAWTFGALFVVEGLVLAWFGATKRGGFRAVADWRSGVGFLAVIYATFLYPVVGLAERHFYPHAPILGMAPCPTTIFTLGFLLMCRPVLTRWIYVIPLVWAAIGSLAAFMLGMREDYGLAVAGILTAIAILPQPHASHHRHTAAPVG